MFKNGAGGDIGYRGWAVANALVRVLAFLFIVWAANLTYGFVHEAAHALVVRALGGQVLELYVNPFGTDAYTLYSYISGATGLVLVELAGMAVTTALAYFTLLSGYTPLPLFIALRTAIYALNYAPGTDMAAVQQAIGNAAAPLSAALVVLNLACVAIALAGPLKKANLKDALAYFSRPVTE